MKLKFKRPLTPNFVQTDKGQFDIKDLSATELNNFISEWKLSFIDNWQKRKRMSEVQKR